MNLMYGAPDSLTFCREVPKGTPLNTPATPKVLVVEDVLEHWGVFRSMEIEVYRDGDRAKNMAITNIGITERLTDRKLVFQFEIHDCDPKTVSVSEHSYRVKANIHFFSCE